MPPNSKDLPLRDDTRLLGRLLGDTVREQEGDDVFAAVEHIRQASVRLNQSPDRELDTAARAELEMQMMRFMTSRHRGDGDRATLQ